MTVPTTSVEALRFYDAKLRTGRWPMADLLLQRQPEPFANLIRERRVSQCASSRDDGLAVAYERLALLASFNMLLEAE